MIFRQDASSEIDMHMLRKFTKCHQQSRVFNGVAAAPLVCIFECLEFL